MNFFHNPINVVITAGASGIGKEIAIAYSLQGCNVFVSDMNAAYVTEFNRQYPEIDSAVLDVAKAKDVESYFNSLISKIDSIDALVNCAGIAGPTKKLQDVEPDEWDDTIQINVNGMFYTLKYAIPLLKKSISGSIINIASSASFFGFPLRSPYTAAKWATIGLTKTLAMELGGDNIRVNAICPGSVVGDRINRVIEADANEQGKSIEEIKSIYVKQISMKTFVEAADVAHLALFLSSNYGRFISGQAIGLDGHTEGLSNNI